MIERQNDAIDRAVLVVSSFADQDSARQVGTTVVESQLAACVNLVPGVTSIYQWKGKIEEEGEVIALIKTTAEKLIELEAFLQENHPYEEPEFIVVPIEAGSTGYLDWIRGSMTGQTAVDKRAT
jgi:periplasmic divalent cation tolerance protein|tara:strand:- start:623 stop:994 length:372 start_codon:yes stop_codon:yes gene_type:complete